MKIIRSLAIQIAVIFAVLAWCYFGSSDPTSMEKNSHDEVSWLVNWATTAEWIIVIGVLIAVTSFFNLSSGLLVLFASFGTGLIVAIFGAFWHISGIGTAIFSLGIMMTIVCWLASGAVKYLSDETVSFMRTLFALGLILVFCGYYIKQNDVPAKNSSILETESFQEKMKRIGNHPEANWWIHVTPKGAYERKTFDFQGRTSDAYATAKRLAKQYEADPDTGVRVVLLNIPPEHARAVGAMKWIDSRKYDERYQ